MSAKKSKQPKAAKLIELCDYAEDLEEQLADLKERSPSREE